MTTARAASTLIASPTGSGPASAASVAMGTPLLQVRDLRIAFGGKPVVDGVSFDVRPGEKLALVGESGSGKSVTALSLLRLLPQAQVSGQALFDTGTGPRDLLTLPERELLGVRGRQIATIFQEPMTALNPLFSVGDQVAEVIELHQGLSRAQAWARAIELLGSTGITEPARRAGAYPHQLSGGQRQRAMIAMALACEPQLLLADEPTTALDATVRLQVLGLLDQLQRTHGMAVVMITHDLHLVRRFANRVLVMQQGRAVEQGDTEALFQSPRQPYTRQLLDSRPQRDVTEVVEVSGVSVKPLMQARGLRVRYPTPLPGLRGWFAKGHFEALKGADFELPVGQTLGVIGESGSGKSTLALAALGLQPCHGELTIQGLHWQGRAAADRPLRRVVQVVFQDPFSSLSPRRTVEETVGEGLGVHHRGLSDAVVREKVLQALSEVGLSETQFPGLLQRYPHEFSGGQRQRLALARALVVDPALLVLDEPTSALDVTIQQQILSLLQHLQRARGLSYLLITHDAEVVAAMAHHVMVLKGGEVVESGAARAVLLTPRSDYTRALLAAAPPLDSLLRPAGG